MLKTSNSLLRSVVIISLGSLFYVYGFVLRIMPSAMTHELMQGFGINAQLLGMLVGFMYWGYTIMQIPSGLLFDRFNARYLLTATMLVCTLGTFLLGATENIVIASCGSFIMGLGEAFGFVGVLVLAARWFPAKYFALIVGIVQLMGSIGAILGEGPIALLVNRYGWRSTILSIACVGLILACLFWLIIRDKPHHNSHPIQNAAKKSKWERFRLVTSNSQNWWVALYSFCIWAPVLILAGLWVVPYLMALYGTSSAIAATATSWVWVGIGLGSPLIGWWSNRIGRRCLPLAVSALLSLIPAILIIYTDHMAWALMSLILFIFGIGGSGQALSFGLVQDNNPPEVAGTAVGLNNMAVVFGGVLLQPLVGILLHLHWQGQYSNGVPIYSVADYRHALITAPICGLFAFIISSFFIKETHCEPQYEMFEQPIKQQLTH